MDPQVYKLHRENEKEHWWYKGRREIISVFIKKFISKKKKLKILDFGAGSGTNTITLSNFGDVYVYEKDKNTQDYLKKKFAGNTNIFLLDEVKEDSLYDLIVASDVIEHIENDDEILNFLSKILNPTGYILITVPAYNFLYNERDKFLGHFRRYNKKTLNFKVDKYFNTIKSSYYNFFLFFLSLSLFVFLKWFKIKSLITSPENTPNFLINNFFYRILASEKFFLRYLNFPFGSSVIHLARKK